MKILTKSIFFCLISISHAASNAHSLSKVVENSEATFYVRTDSLKKNGSSVDFWQITDFKRPKLNKKGESYLSIESHLVIDCSASTQDLIFVKVFSSNMLTGQMIAGGSLKQRNPIPYGTSLEVIKTFVCR